MWFLEHFSVVEQQRQRRDSVTAWKHIRIHVCLSVCKCEFFHSVYQTFSLGIFFALNFFFSSSSIFDHSHRVSAMPADLFGFFFGIHHLRRLILNRFPSWNSVQFNCYVFLFCLVLFCLVISLSTTMLFTNLTTLRKLCHSHVDYPFACLLRWLQFIYKS